METKMKYANMIGWTDIAPYEVVRAVNAKLMEIREMAAVELPWEKQFFGGGFLGHVVNGEDQRWEITQNLDAPITRIRLHGDGKWYDKDGQRYALADEPRRYYDYNF
jgi:hypothetical protein